MGTPAAIAAPDKPSALLSVLSVGVPGGSASGLLGRPPPLDTEYSHSAANTSASPEPPSVAANPTSASHSVDQKPGRSCTTDSTSGISDRSLLGQWLAYMMATIAKDPRQYPRRH
jgi:hypothetical protein